MHTAQCPMCRAFNYLLVKMLCLNNGYCAAWRRFWPMRTQCAPAGCYWLPSCVLAWLWGYSSWGGPKQSLTGNKKEHEGQRQYQHEIFGGSYQDLNFVSLFAWSLLYVLYVRSASGLDENDNSDSAVSCPPRSLTLRFFLTAESDAPRCTWHQGYSSPVRIFQ